MKVFYLSNYPSVSRMTKFILAMLLSTVFGFRSQASSKTAVLVGISKYTDDSGWGTTSADNDLKIMRKSLENRGFDDIISLENALATKASFLQELDRLFKTCQKGDELIIYFSGHGQLIKDYNADEYDQYDESLVLYGAPKYYDAAYKNENHLLDDELSVIINKFRMKLGNDGSILLLVDAGFGWVGASGDTLIRGGAAPLEPSSRGSFTQTPGIYEAGIIDDLPFAQPSKEYAAFTHMTASTIMHVAHEYGGNGIFTLALTRALDELKDTTTRGALFDQCKTLCLQLNKSQRPVMEGNSESLVLKEYTNRNYHTSVVAPISEEEYEILSHMLDEIESEVKKESGLSDYEKSYFRND